MHTHIIDARATWRGMRGRRGVDINLPPPPPPYFASDDSFQNSHKEGKGGGKKAA